MGTHAPFVSLRSRGQCKQQIRQDPIESGKRNTHHREAVFGPRKWSAGRAEQAVHQIKPAAKLGSITGATRMALLRQSGNQGHRQGQIRSTVEETRHFFRKSARRRLRSRSLGCKFFHLFASISPNSAEFCVSTILAIDPSLQRSTLHIVLQVYLRLYCDSSICSRVIIYESPHLALRSLFHRFATISPNCAEVTI